MSTTSRPIYWTHIGRILWTNSGQDSTHRAGDTAATNSQVPLLHHPQSNGKSVFIPESYRGCRRPTDVFRMSKKSILVTIIIYFIPSTFSFCMPQIPQVVHQLRESCISASAQRECSMLQVTKPWSCTVDFGPGGALNHGGTAGRTCRARPGRDHPWPLWHLCSFLGSSQEWGASYQIITWCCGASWCLGWWTPPHALPCLILGSATWSYVPGDCLVNLRSGIIQREKWGHPKVPRAHWWGLRMSAGAEPLNPNILCPEHK